MRERGQSWQAYRRKISLAPAPDMASYLPQNYTPKTRIHEEVCLAPYDPVNDKIVEFHASTKRIRAVFGGNRSGKTESGIYDDLKCVCTPKTEILLATKTNDMIGRFLWPKIKKYLPARFIRKIVWSNPGKETPAMIRLTNSSTIFFMSYDQKREAFQGFGGCRRVHFDEEAPKDIYTEAVRGVIDSGGDVLLTMTPLKGLTWVYTDIFQRAGIDPNIAAWTISLLENKHIAQSEKDFFISLLSKDEQAKRIEGRFVALSGMVFKDYDPTVNVCDPFLIPHTWRKVRAIDLGFSNPFVCLWGAIDEQGETLYVYQEHYRAGLLLEEHKNIILRMDREGITDHPWPVGLIEASVCDHEAQTRAELNNLGINTAPAKKDLEVGIERTNRRFKVQPNGITRLKIFRTCENTIREVQNYRYKEADERRNIPEEPIKLHDHTCDALRYLVMYFEQDDSGEVHTTGTRAFPVDLPFETVNPDFFDVFTPKIF